MARNNKPHQEFVIVAEGAMQRAGSLYATGNTVNLANRQLGVVSADPFSATLTSNNFLTGGETAAQVKKIRLVAGSSNSANTSKNNGRYRGYKTPPYWKSPIIEAGQIESVVANVNPVGTYSAVAYTGFSTVVASTDYFVFPVLRSVLNDKYYTHNADFDTVDFTTNDLVGVVDSQDYLLQNLLHKFNLNSIELRELINNTTFGSKEMLGLAIDIDGASGGVALGTLAVGDTIPVMTYNGVTYNFTADADFVQSVNQWIASAVFTAATTIIPIDITTAGAVANTDSMVFLGLSHEVALAHDDVYSSKVSITAELGGAFVDSNNARQYTVTTLSQAAEDQGTGRLFKIKYDERAFGTHNLSLAGHSDVLLTAPNDISLSENYTCQIINLYNDDKGRDNGNISHQARIWILSPRADNTGVATGTTGVTTTTRDAATLIVDLNATLGAWIISDSKSNPDYLNAATSAVPFV